MFRTEIKQVVKTLCEGCKKSFEELNQVKIQEFDFNLLKPNIISEFQKSTFVNQLVFVIDGIMDSILIDIPDNECEEIINAMRIEIQSHIDNIENL